MTRTSRSRLVPLFIAAALVAGAFTAVTPTVAGACAGVTRKADVFRKMRSGSDMSARSMETIGLRTLNIEFKADKKIYNPGEIAQIKVKVTRPAKEDPMGQGIPMERPYVEPAAGVNVGIGIAIGRVFLPGAGLTDENGEATVKIKIESYAPSGEWADASAYAWKIIMPTPCATVQEDGYQIYPRMFRTGPRAGAPR